MDVKIETMPTEREILLSFVGKTLNISGDEAATLLFEKVDDKEVIKADALDGLLEKDKARVQRFATERTEAHDKGYKKAQAESLTKFEKDIKEKFGVTEDKQGLDLIESVVAAKVKANGGEMDEEKIKRSTVYLNAIDKLTKEKTDAVKIEQDKFTQLQSSIQRDTTFKTISEKALAIINELQPILPEGTTADGKKKAEVQIQKLLKELGSEYEYEIKDNKLLVIKDGKVLEDVHGHMVDFKDIVKEKATEIWDFKQGEQRKGPGNNNDGEQGDDKDKGYKGPIPKNETEYMELMSKAKDGAEKIQINDLWRAEKQKNNS